MSTPFLTACRARAFLIVMYVANALTTSWARGCPVDAAARTHHPQLDGRLIFTQWRPGTFAG
jgi:hypothetical protein